MLRQNKKPRKLRHYNCHYSRVFLYLKKKYPQPARILFLPDYTVGAGISPVQFSLAKKREVAGYTAGRELHPTLKI